MQVPTAIGVCRFTYYKHYFGITFCLVKELKYKFEKKHGNIPCVF